MSFFDPPSAQPADAPSEVPAWIAAPRGRIAGLVPDRRVVAEGSSVAVVLSHIDAYAEGCELVLQLHLVRDPGEDRHGWERLLRDFDLSAQSTSGEGSDGVGGRLRFAVALPDGSRLEAGLRTLADEEPEGPLLQRFDRGSGGGAMLRHADKHVRLWLCPLLPAAPFDLFVQWATFDVPETRITVDGAAVHSAARRSHKLFAHHLPPPP